MDRQIREAQIVTDTNEHIREANRAALQGPASTVMPLDEEQTVRKWRQGRASEDR